MKIPKQLPQFEGQTALCLVAADQAADFFIAKDGELNKVATIVIEKPEYSDRESVSQRVGLGYESGDKGDKNKKLLRQDLVKQVKEELRKIATPSVVFLFAPNDAKRDLEAALPRAFAAKLKKVIGGNFHKEQPLKWFEHVKSSLK